ncbi:hypothetical protein [Epilithonimonas caeni]|uniref:hypothetical protein n=1 Tax=Epilithonimonas caeni TaxID=365343 RepID=UPI000416E9A1|nr:hypothetical protein [Epilithonimonas caeni]
MNENIEIFREKVENTFDIKGKELIFLFMITFSRFECALKESSFHNHSPERLEVNWDLFIKSIQDQFNPDITTELKNAVNYIINHPPKIQIYDNNCVLWKQRVFSNEPLIKKLSICIRTVRNNLFHGGKFNGTFKEDERRNYKLLHNSIIIFNDWLNLNDVVKENFQNDIK